MGEVYRADDLMLGQSVALKFLPTPAPTKSASATRCASRARCLIRMSAVYTTPVRWSGQWYLSMEYVDGEDLGSLLRRIGRLPADKALEIARKLCARPGSGA